MDLSTVLTVTTIASSGISLGALRYIFTSAVRLEVLERLFNDKKKSLEEIAISQVKIDTRLALVEQAVIGINNLLPELHKFGSLGDKLEALLQTQNERLNRMEDAR